MLNVQGHRISLRTDYHTDDPAIIKDIVNEGHVVYAFVRLAQDIDTAYLAKIVGTTPMLSGIAFKCEVAFHADDWRPVRVKSGQTVADGWDEICCFIVVADGTVPRSQSLDMGIEPTPPMGKYVGGRT